MGIQLGADVNAVYSTLSEGNTPALGDLYYGAGGKAYKFVQYVAGTAAVDGVTGEVAYYSAAGAGQDFTVTSDLSDSANIGAGVLQASPADTEYCWVQVKGPATLSIALTAGADGNALTPVGATDGTLDVSALVTDHVCAYADDASANEIICDFPM